jgi:hypothetical protein
MSSEKTMSYRYRQRAWLEAKVVYHRKCEHWSDSGWLHRSVRSDRLFKTVQTVGNRNTDVIRAVSRKLPFSECHQCISIQHRASYATYNPCISDCAVRSDGQLQQSSPLPMLLARFQWIFGNWCVHWPTCGTGHFHGFARHRMRINSADEHKG